MDWIFVKSLGRGTVEPALIAIVIAGLVLPVFARFPEWNEALVPDQ